MTAQAASVIIASRHRSAALLRCIQSLTQQDHPNFEVIVVADPAAVAAVRVLHPGLKLAEFDRANLAEARNTGIGLAAGQVVAFIDDDAVAEPTWLTRLTAPLAQQGVLAATGFVRGRNGISWQWQGIEVDALGQDHALAVPEAGLRRAASRRQAVKLLGCNMAFRRETLLALGGFDPAFRFYLEDADISLRLYALSGVAAIVPGAEVLHGFDASARRRADRVPLDLSDIGASTAVFLRRHSGEAAMATGWTRLKAAQAARIVGHVKAKRLTPEAARALEISLETGWAEGCARVLEPLTPLPDAAPDFARLPDTGSRKGLVLSGRIWQRKGLKAKASAARAKGRIVTVICLSPTPRAHRRYLSDDGIWWQEGGLFGRSSRDGPQFRWATFRKRIVQEVSSLARNRPVE
jgi:O-antigen biosynthesis protein